MKQKMEDFFYYYKYHVIAVCVVVLILLVLVADGGEKNTYRMVLADNTSELSLEHMDKLIMDFEKQSGWKERVGFRYRSYYLNQDKYKDISFDVAGIQSYEQLIEEGKISLVLTNVEAPVNEYLLISLEEYLTQDEYKQYEPYFYEKDGAVIGLIFNKSLKAKEYFGDDYPTEYHYILQIPKGSKDNEDVKVFLSYLFASEP